MNNEISNEIKRDIIETINSSGHFIFWWGNSYIRSFICDFDESDNPINPQSFAIRGHNVIVWELLSVEAYFAILEIVDGNTSYELVPCSALDYMYAETLPNMPIATKVKTYKKPHWYPMKIVKKHRD